MRIDLKAKPIAKENHTTNNNMNATKKLAHLDNEITILQNEKQELMNKWNRHINSKITLAPQYVKRIQEIDRTIKNLENEKKKFPAQRDSQQENLAKKFVTKFRSEDPESISNNKRGSYHDRFKSKEKYATLAQIVSPYVHQDQLQPNERIEILAAIFSCLNKTSNFSNKPNTLRRPLMELLIDELQLTRFNGEIATYRHHSTNYQRDLYFLKFHFIYQKYCHIETKSIHTSAEKHIVNKYIKFFEHNFHELSNNIKILHDLEGIYHQQNKTKDQKDLPFKIDIFTEQVEYSVKYIEHHLNKFEKYIMNGKGATFSQSITSLLATSFSQLMSNTKEKPDTDENQEQEQKNLSIQ